MTRNFVIAITCSILLHFIILFAVLPDKKTDSQTKPPENTISAELLSPDTPSDEDKKEQTIRMLKGDIYYRADDKPAIDKVDAAMCDGKDNTYIGAGIMIQPGTDLVTSAPPQYPAYKSGIRVGDKLVDPFGSDVMPDGYIDFTVLRGTELITFHIKAENICYKNKS